MHVPLTEVILSHAPGDTQRVEEFLQRHRLALLTMLFTDIVGSTKLKQDLGDRAAIEIIERHHAIIRATLAQFPDAEEIDTAGDSFFIVFAKPSDAVHFALKLQSALRVLTRETGHAVRDRIGIHVGEIFIQQRESGGRDLFGIQIDTAARVMSLGDGDQILLSRFAFDSARHALRGQDTGLGELSWLNHGCYAMKGVEEPVEVCEVGESGLAVLLAPGDSEKAHRYVSPDSEPVLGWRPADGQTVPNTQWTLERLLGKGGFGEVWLARHQTLKDRRVFKFCFKADKARSLKREVTLFKVLRERIGASAGVVAVHDVFFDEPPYYIVMDYIDGPNLAGWAEAHLPLNAVPLETRLEIIAQVADALQSAHDAGVIHRDVKPANILIEEKDGQPRVKLTDFGIGQVVSGEALAGITQGGFTQTMVNEDSLTGTQLYLAPEMLAGRPATIRSDIYALGVMLYQLATGALNRPLTSDWADDITDPLLREDIRNCVAGDPAKRFAGGAQLAAHLRTLPQRRMEQESVERLRARTARRKKQMRLVSFAAVVVAIAAIFFAFAFLRERDLKLEVAAGGLRANAALAELRKTAPAFLAQARTLLDEQKPEEALGKIGYAIDLAPEVPDYHLFKANTLQALQRLRDAMPEYQRTVALRPDDASARLNLALSERLLRDNGGQPQLSRNLQSDLLDALLKQKRNADAAPLAAILGREAETVAGRLLTRLKSITALPLWYDSRVERLPNGTFKVDIGGLPVPDLSVLSGFPISELSVGGCGATDLAPLKGLPLRKLNCSGLRITSLEPLRGMKLEYLDCNNTRVTDLSPLTGMPLWKLNFGETPVIDLEPLRGMPMRELDLVATGVRDLSPLQGMPLEKLIMIAVRVRDLKPLAGMPLVRLDAEGCHLLESLEPLRGLPLKELTLHDCKKIKDLSPLADCPSLESLVLPSPDIDLSVIKKLPHLLRLTDQKLSAFDWDMTQIPTVAEFFGRTPEQIAQQTARREQIQKIKASINAASHTGPVYPKITFDADGGLSVTIEDNSFRDLSVFRGFPIKALYVRGTQVADLSPLAGMTTLQRLEILHTKVTDLSALAGLSLRWLDFGQCPIADLTPLRGMPLEVVSADVSNVKDISILGEFPTLKTVLFPKGATGAEALRHLPNLKYLSDEWSGDVEQIAKPAAEFWARYDAQEKTRLQIDEQMPQISAAMPGAKAVATVWGIKLLLDKLNISDLRPLRALSIDWLSLSGSEVTDLSPLRGLRMKVVDFNGTNVTDARPLLDMPMLEAVILGEHVTNLEVLRHHPTIKYLGWLDDWDYSISRSKLTTAEFWARYDAQKKAGAK